jgi:hypothetical protein
MDVYDFDSLKKLVEKLFEELKIDEQYLEFCGKTPDQKISQQTATDLLYVLHPIRRIKNFWHGST